MGMWLSVRELCSDNQWTAEVFWRGVRYAERLVEIDLEQMPMMQVTSEQIVDMVLRCLLAEMVVAGTA